MRPGSWCDCLRDVFPSSSDPSSECPGYDNLTDCAGSNLELACDANGMVATVGCEDVFVASVVPCLGG